jgi:hypothetical protein
MTDTTSQAPTAPRRPYSFTRHGITVTDEYAWLKDARWQEVLHDPALLDTDIRSHLEAENAYAEAVLGHTAPLQKTLVKEMRGRIKEDDSSVPSPDGPYSYFRKYREGGQHELFCRMPRNGGAETIGLDGDALAKGHDYFKFGATSVSAYWERRHATNTASSRASYIFAADANGDGVTNDLIYIPKDTSEMNFAQFTAANGTVFTPDQQAAAFDQLIKSDDYLTSRRGQYAQRNGGRFPMFQQLDLSIAQDIFTRKGGNRNAFQFRADFLNFGNLLNHDWGVGWRSVAAINNNNQIQLLTNPGVDAQGRINYRLATANNQLITNLWANSSSANSDVYQFMLSLRYSFN